MPRKPRIDAKGLLSHIIVRGIEGSRIFRDDKDRNAFLSRLGEILKETSTPIYAFALIPNHAHLLLRRGKTPISTLMRRLLTGYAIYFNKRHARSGYLFQNRYKATICQDDPYFLELIRYIHLNPIRAGLLDSIESLRSYRFSGHSYLLGKSRSDWFDPDCILVHFAKTEDKARSSYLKFLEDGLNMNKKAELEGGGLIRSLGYPKQYPKIKQAFDDRVLGEGDFVEELLALSNEAPAVAKPKPDLSLLISSVCSKFGVSEPELFGETRKRPVAEARAALAYRMSKELGLSGSSIARELELTRSAVSKMIRKGEELQRDLRDVTE